MSTERRKSNEDVSQQRRGRSVLQEVEVDLKTALDDFFVQLSGFAEINSRSISLLHFFQELSVLVLSLLKFSLLLKVLDFLLQVFHLLDMLVSLENSLFVDDDFVESDGFNDIWLEKIMGSSLQLLGKFFQCLEF